MSLKLTSFSLLTSLSLLSACQMPIQRPLQQLNAFADSAPALESEGQKYQLRDEGHAYGFFHSYNAFKACAAPGGLGRKLHILLPRDYAANSRQAYPVVYMNDGSTAFFANNSVGRSWDVAGTLSALKAQQLIQDVIVVGVTSAARDSEYTYAPFADQRQCCQAEQYARELANCIKPFIDRNYRTLPQPEHTAIVGSSHGGLSSFFIATRQPQTFGSAASLSPSFWAGLDYNYLDVNNKQLANSGLIEPIAPLLANSTLRPKFWIDWGLRRDGGTLNEVIERLASKRSKEMAELLQKRFGYHLGQDLYLYEDPTGGHDENAWKPRFGMMMKAFFPKQAARN